MSQAGEFAASSLIVGRATGINKNGGVAERPKAAVLKTVDAQASVGSNPTSSAIFIFVSL